MPRNSSGTYSLPAGNPVTPNTLIETSWANPTMSDIGSAITDSLDRYGRGGMLAQLKLADGTVTAPAFAFNSESSTGLYRPLAGTLNVALLGNLLASFTASAVTFSQNVYAPNFIPSSPTSVVQFQPGTAALPGLAVVGDLNTGFYQPGADIIAGTTAGGERFRFSANGFKVGVDIGNMPFSVGADSSLISAFRNTGAGSARGLYIRADNTTGIVQLDATGAGAGILSLASGAVEGARVDTSANFLVGGSTAYGRLDLTGAMHVNTTNADVGGWIEALGSTELSIAGGARYNSFSSPNYVYTAKATVASGVRSANGGVVIWGNTGLTAGNTFSSTPRLTVDNAGNVGIGVSSPTTLGGNIRVLEIMGLSAARGGGLALKSSDSSLSGVFYMADGLGFLGNRSAHPLALLTNDVERARIDGSTGNLAVGIVPNAARFTVGGGALTSTSSNSLGISSQLAAGRLSTGDTNSQTAAIHSYLDSSITEISAGSTAAYVSGIVMASRNAAVDPGTVKLYSYSTEVLRVNSSQGVGVGTAGGAGKLDVDSGAGGIWSNYNSTNANGGYLRFQRSGTAIADIGTAAQIVSGGGVNDFGINTRGANNLIFAVNSAERGRFNASGFFGVNVNPSAIFHAKNTDELGRFESTTARGGGRAYVTFYDPTGSKGFIGYGSANDQMQVVNQMAAGMVLSTNGVAWLTATSAGAATFSGSVTATSFVGPLTGTASVASTVVTGATDGAGIELGYKGLPPASVTSGSPVLADKGKCVYATAGVTVPNAVFAQGESFAILNTTGASITITAGVTTLTQAGTTNTGNRTLLANGIATVVYKSSTSAVISGNIT